MGGEDRGEYRGVEWSRAGYGRVKGREGRAKERGGLS